MKKAILALDQGTTSSRAILFDRNGNILADAQQEFRQFYPQPGWVEHDPLEIWETQLQTARAAIQKAGLNYNDIDGIGITNQRETTLLWDRKTGQPLHPAIVWQDRRTSSFCDELKTAGHAKLVQDRTGLVIDAYFSASKIRWLLDNIPQARERAEKGELVFGTVDTWLVYNLTGGQRTVTDPSNASRTMLFNLHKQCWDEELLQLLDIPRAILPEIVPTSGVCGETTPDLFGGPIPIAGMAGDQQSALFGQNCFEVGMGKNTYGTGCFLLTQLGSKPVPSKHQLITTVAWQTNHQTHYAMEGSIFIGGAVVQWLRDELGLISSSAEIEQLASTVPDSAGVYLVPAFAGLGAPHWDQYARGTITGLTRGTSKGHLARAALEGIAFQVADVLQVMQQDTGGSLHQLRVDGGASANNLLMQFQADILQLPVIRPKTVETTALGAAYLAGLATGFWASHEEVQASWQIDRAFEPAMSADEAAHRCSRWSQALQRAREWEQPSA
ncbi:MAG: glycerol kinase GlpK [Limisphaerales bacterium]